MTLLITLQEERKEAISFVTTISSLIVKSAKTFVRAFALMITRILACFLASVYLSLILIPASFFFSVFLSLRAFLDNYISRKTRYFIYWILTVILFAFFIFFTYRKSEPKTEANVILNESSNEICIEQKLKLDFDVLADALIQVESLGNDLAVSKTSSAAGCLQQLNCNVDEANRLAKLYHLDVTYSYEDRFNREKAKEMFFLIQSHHNPDSSFIRAVTLHRGKVSLSYTQAVESLYIKLYGEKYGVHLTEVI